MVKRTFITKDLCEHNLAQWISWLKVIVDGIVFL